MTFPEVGSIIGNYDEKLKAFYLKRFESQDLIQREPFQDMFKASGVSDGFAPEQFSSKRLRYKRYLRRKNTKLRAYWLMRGRFFFSNQYNNLFELHPKIELLDLYRLLEYFYFILINDRDLYETAEYTFIVSGLRERFGSAIVSDLLSTTDHKQASKVSVIMHIKEDVLNSKVNDQPFEILAEDEVSNLVFSTRAHRFPVSKFNSRVFVSRDMQSILYHLLVYYSYLDKENKK